MSIFRKKEEEYEDEEELEETPRQRRIRDLKPEYKKKRKEPPKPWGKKERLLVLFFLVGTVLISAVLGLSSRNWKLPGMPNITFSKPDFNFFKEETIIIGGKSEGKQKALKAANVFENKVMPYTGTYALYVLRLEDGSGYGVNENKKMQAASLIKLPMMAAVYMQAEKKELSLADKPQGQTRSYQELVEAMGKASDNEAFRIVRKALGDEIINQTARDIGMSSTSLVENETTPKDVGLFFDKLWKAEFVSSAHRDEFLGYLTDTIFENWLAAGIMDVRVAHKYGKETHVVNDAGIVYAQKPFVLVIMSQGIVEREADQLIPELAAEIYDIEK